MSTSAEDRSPGQMFCSSFGTPHAVSTGRALLYLVPVKVAVQRAEAIGEGAIVEVVVRLNAARRE